MTTDDAHPTPVGHGTLVSGGAFEGVAAAADDPADVVALVGRSDVNELVLIVASPSATALVPLMASVRGVICLGGGPTSHLALIAREFGLPCLMSAQIDSVEQVPGAMIRVAEDGGISIA